MTLIEENVSVSRKATLLLGEILRMANRILPSRYAAQLQALPKLFNGATAFSDANERHFALSALTSINSLDRNQAHAHRHLHGLSRPRPSRLRASSLNNVSGTATGGEVVERARGIRGVRDRMGISVEDKLFQQMIVDSGVCALHQDTRKKLTHRYYLGEIIPSGTLTSSLTSSRVRYIRRSAWTRRSERQSSFDG